MFQMEKEEGEYSSCSHLISVLSCKAWRYYLQPSPLPAGLFKIAADNLRFFSVIAKRAGVTDRMGASSA